MANAAARQIIDLAGGFGEIRAGTSHAAQVLVLYNGTPLTFCESWDQVRALLCNGRADLARALAARRVDMETAVIVDVVINSRAGTNPPSYFHPLDPLSHPSISYNHAELSVLLHRPGSKCGTILPVGQQDTLRPPSSRQPGRSEHKHYELIGLDHPQDLDFSCYKPSVPYS